MKTIDKIKAQILGHVPVKASGSVLASGDLTHQARRAAERMKLFERDGMIHYGTWRSWWRAGTAQERAILKAFQGG